MVGGAGDSLCVLWPLLDVSTEYFIGNNILKQRPERKQKDEEEELRCSKRMDSSVEQKLVVVCLSPFPSTATTAGLLLPLLQ